MVNPIKKFFNLIIGPMRDKRNYKQFIKRANALPKDYRYVFRKMRKYMESGGISLECGMNEYVDLLARGTEHEGIYMRLLELFEVNAAEGKEIVEVIGNDAAAFCDDYIRAFISKGEKERLNHEIIEKLKREVK